MTTTTREETVFASWNYRVLAKAVDGPQYQKPAVEFSIIEAYYDAEGNLVAYCDAGPSVSDDSAQAIADDLRYQLEAFRRPVLGTYDLPG